MGSVMSNIVDHIENIIWTELEAQVERFGCLDMTKVAAAVVKELGLTQIWAPCFVGEWPGDGYILPRWNESYDDKRQAEKVVADESGSVLGTAHITGFVRDE